MANKIYIVVKDGEELEKLKTLAVAKKQADAEWVEVYCDGKCVYEGTVSPTEEKTAEAVAEKPTVRCAPQSAQSFDNAPQKLAWCRALKGKDP